MRLKELRKQAKLTQSELASKLNITQKTYSNYENEVTEPSIELLKDLSNFYNVSIDYLVGKDSNFGLGFLTEEQFENFKAILNLSKNKQSKVFGYVASLSEIDDN